MYLSNKTVWFCELLKRTVLILIIKTEINSFTVTTKGSAVTGMTSFHLCNHLWYCWSDHSVTASVHAYSLVHEKGWGRRAGGRMQAK